MPTQDFTSEMIGFVMSNDKYKEITKPRTKSLANEEVKKYYALNATANVLIGTTSDSENDANPKLLEKFQLAQGYFSKISGELTRNGKSIFDYEALSGLISASNHFASVKKETKSFVYKSHDLTLNTALLNDLIGSMTAIGGALNIGKKLLESIGNEISFSVSKSQHNRDIGHILFVCEDLLGIPIVSLSLFRISAYEGSKAVNVGCAKKSKKNIALNYNQEVFMFVSPEILATI